MKIVCLSDTHNKHKQINLPEGDIVVHCGDFSSRGYSHELEDFTEWYGSLDYKHKVLIAGNHDIGTETGKEAFRTMCLDNNIIYLCDSGVTLEGLKFWGSPVTPRFGIGWAWNRDVRDSRSASEISNYVPFRDIKPHWSLIPSDTDILLTHGPPYGILDFTYYGKMHVGCPILLETVERVEPMYHIFGHIHEEAGFLKLINTTFVNASICTLQYEATNKPIVIEVNNEK